jgi:hypothetical protein
MNLRSSPMSLCADYSRYVLPDGLISLVFLDLMIWKKDVFLPQPRGRTNYKAHDDAQTARI